MKWSRGHVAAVSILGAAMLPSIVMAANSSSIQILSATIRDQKIGGATVILQKTGEQSVAVTTNTDGRAEVSESDADDPATLVIVRMPGYSDLIAKCPCAGMTYALSPPMKKLDGMRIVLNWGRDPLDLDGHLAFPGNHVFFNKKLGRDAQLDIDHTDGFGPETVTVERKHAGERYMYAVQDYSDLRAPESDRLSHSGAKVFVYIGQTLIRAYYVPVNKPGNVWTVFAVSEEGEIQDINTMGGINVSQIDQLTTDVVFGAAVGGENPSAPFANPTAPLTVAPADVLAARKLNVQGEAAYRGGDLAGAIRLFQTAIEINDSYGQAYSNLGLVFQKSGRVAEALWANRKAIALASGPTASTTRASTHFNNGKIYEDAGQWADAAREYGMAQNDKENPVYEKAIQRMRDRGAN
jgi:hypothetical protein